jgi:hypothetical protein
MTIIPQQQLFDRWDTLPDSLRDAIFDEPTTDFIWKTSEDEHISDDQIYTISKLVGYVFMGFLHPEDLGEEIKERLNIDMRIAQAIQDDLNKRIFAPLRPDLDKVYKPLAKSEASTGPIILNDIGTVAVSSAPKTISISAPAPKPQPIAVSTATSQTLSASPTIKGAAIANNNIPPTAPKVNRLSDVGWSRSRSADPVVKLDITPTPGQKPEVPTPVSTPSAQPQQQSRPQAPAFSQPAVPTNHALGEFERLNAMKKASAAPTITPSVVVAAPTTPGIPKPPAPAPTSTSADPSPFMLHQDASAHIQDKNTAFVLPKPGASAQVQMSPVKIPVPVRPAVLEFGTSGTSAPKPPTPTSISSNAVHYTQFSASLSSIPTANTGPRNISEVAAAPATQAPIAPKVMPINPAASIPVPRPPKPPMPPTLQAAQQPQAAKEKVIVKDFL